MSKKDFPICHDLIPGLPSAVAMECLVRVPYHFQPVMKSVCRSWRTLLSDASLLKERRRYNKAELLLCLVQPLLPPIKAVDDTLMEEESKKKEHSSVFVTPRFGLSVYNASINTWNRVDIQIPLFCECVVLQESETLLLLGGWDPETLQPVSDVYILELVSRKWRKGASMKQPRSFFACGLLGATKVYVAGGHDEEKNALRSAEMYDVERDVWFTLPEMKEERDECWGVAVGTEVAFCVLSGYDTEAQGRFKTNGEVYDHVTSTWSKVENIWPFVDTSPRGRVVGGSSKLVCFTERELESDTKLELEMVKLPMTGSSVFAGRLGSEAMVMVSEGVMMTTSTENGKWGRVRVPSGYSTLPFSYGSIYV